MIRLSGYGLRTAAPCAVAIARTPGPARIRKGDRETPLRDLRVVDAERATTVAADGIRVATVEHLFAALAAAGAHEGVTVEVEGPEIPFLDGAARAFLDAVLALEIPPSPPSLRVACEGTVEVGSSRYVFTPGPEVALEVVIDYGDPRLSPRATWDGALASFRERIASARTFAFAHEVEGLADRGLVAHVAKESAVVLAKDAVLFAGAPFEPDEPARHKLLDLAGDLFVWGGPPSGRVRAERPGHAATHAAVEKALHDGIVEFTRV